MDTLELKETWSFDYPTNSWVCGTRNDGAGVFSEDGSHEGSPEGWYFGVVVYGDIIIIADGPYPTKEIAQVKAEGYLHRARENYSL